jgi:TetR/AcrR family transcriptional regulator, transcriptional repressor for nem operon
MGALPTTERGRLTRQRIVAAATEVVAEKGALGASLDEVGARAAASRSQLYHYFNDKNDLLRAVAEATNDTVLDGQRDLFARLSTWDGLGSVGRCARRVAARTGRERRLPDRQPPRPGWRA